MDKNILKKFAIESRNELREKIENKIKTFYINDEFEKEQNGEIVLLSNKEHSLPLSRNEYESRKKLIDRIEKVGLDQVVEESAYTWFNRFIAIRYMEINNFLPLTRDNQSLGIRVLSSVDNEPIPEIMKISNLTNPDLNIEFNIEKYSGISDQNKKFEYILLLVCKKLSQVIPQVFGGITDYIDLLIPDNLLLDSGYITKLLKTLKEEDFKEVEIIGWLYQYYISEKKDEIFDSLKNNKKIEKNDIPAATQLFTPDWIVKYLVENTLGKYLKNKEELNYYVSSDEKIEENDIEKITFIDPCCGSGHILVYAFEIFYKIYMEKGFTKEVAVEKILANNLYGIDIDYRAVQLTILTLCLRAREYDKNIFNKDIIKKMNIITIYDSNNISSELIGYNIPEKYKEANDYIVTTFKNASQYGSLIKCSDNYDYDNFYKDINIDNFIGLDYYNMLIKQAKILSNKYSVVCTNPPYMGRKNMNECLSDFLSTYYPNNKSEMYTAFIERCNEFTQKNGYQAMITIHTWMFIASYESTRKYILNGNTIVNMLHTGPATFPELSSFNVLATAFCLKKAQEDIESTFIRLVDYYNPIEKINNFGNKKLYYKIRQSKLYEIPGTPFIYWISDKLRKAFIENKQLGEYYPPKQGLATADNNKFLRMWYEVCIENIKFNCKSCSETKNSPKKWYPYNKGGDYRKWYGNNECVVNWENDGYEIRNFTDGGKKIKSRPQNTQYYFNKGITWSLFGFENFGVRYKDYGFIFDVSGSSMFPDSENIYYVIGYLCSNIAFKFLSLLAPTVNFQIGNIASLPYKEISDKSIINTLVKRNIEICKYDWDKSEISWDFQKSPIIIENETRIDDSLRIYKEKYSNFRNELRNNEKKLNEIYNNIFEVQEVDTNINDRDLTLKPIEDNNIIKEFISYAVGCMFGRYSLDKDGLIFAGGTFDENNYKTFKADNDNIIPITDEAYFSDDIVERFKIFIKTVYGDNTFNENMDFIAEALGKKGTETSEETIRRYFVNDFFNDHIKMYQKRPIYWLLDSGKKNGFKALVYMHRYNENLIPKARLDYLHRVQTTYEKLLSDVNYKLTTDLSMTDKKEAKNRQTDLMAKLQEIKEYDEKIAHIANQRISVDLDDGVKANYDKFKDILAKIK